MNERTIDALIIFTKSARAWHCALTLPQTNASHNEGKHLETCFQTEERPQPIPFLAPADRADQDRIAGQRDVPVENKGEGRAFQQFRRVQRL